MADVNSLWAVPIEMVWMRLLTVSRSSCCWCCRTVLLEETLSSCCSSSPIMAVCLRMRTWSCSFSSRSFFNSTCRCSSISSTFFSRKLKRCSKQDKFVLCLCQCEHFCYFTHLFLSLNLFISLVWIINCFSNLLVDMAFSRSFLSSRVVWVIT